MSTSAIAIPQAIAYQLCAEIRQEYGGNRLPFCTAPGGLSLRGPAAFDRLRVRNGPARPPRMGTEFGRRCGLPLSRCQSAATSEAEFIFAM